MTVFIQDRQVARERAKRRLVAQTIRSQYKYRDPSKIPAKASPLTEAKVIAHQATRPAPFAAAAASGRASAGGSRGTKSSDGGGASGGRGTDPGPATRDSSGAQPAGSMSDANLDRTINGLSGFGMQGVGAAAGLLSGLPIGTVLSAANWLAKREKSKRWGANINQETIDNIARDRTERSGEGSGVGRGGADYGAGGYGVGMGGGSGRAERSGVVTVHDVFDRKYVSTRGG